MQIFGLSFRSNSLALMIESSFLYKNFLQVSVYSTSWNKFLKQQVWTTCCFPFRLSSNSNISNSFHALCKTENSQLSNEIFEIPSIMSSYHVKLFSWWWKSAFRFSIACYSLFSPLHSLVSPFTSAFNRLLLTLLYWILTEREIQCS